MGFKKRRYRTEPLQGAVPTWNSADKLWEASVKALSAMWPVGAVFIAVVATNPSILLGFGTWTAFGAGRVPVGIDAAQIEFDTSEKTGGEKSVTLSLAQIPSHAHTYTAPNAASNRLAGLLGSVDGVTAGTATGTAGEGEAHNNLQPYIVVYMWKRTA